MEEFSHGFESEEELDAFYEREDVRDMESTWYEVLMNYGGCVARAA